MINRRNQALIIRESNEEEENCWRRMEKFVDAIIEALHDDLEDQLKEMSLPKEFKACIREMNGAQLILVYEKELFKTDINSVENRLSIPLNQMRKEFLTEREKVKVQEEGMEVQLLQPSLKVCTITLKKWQMKPTCFLYVLTKQWNSVVRDNSLKAKDFVQVWSFRVESELRFALVRRNIEEEEEDEEEE